MAKNSDKKDKIRARYQKVDLLKDNDIEVIPITVKPASFETDEFKRVCAYARVSTDNENQTTSIELQKATYENMIKSHENWEYVGLYYDEGITGTSTEKREGFKKMIEDCRAGKIDLIITKSVSRFARNLVDNMAIQLELSRLNPPVGVFFETEHVYSLDSKIKMTMANLAMHAEWESQNKSEIMNWSIDKRYEFGQFIIPDIFGYEKDENDDYVINEAEAPLIRLFYYMFLRGFGAESLAEIATHLGFQSRSKKDGWSASSIIKMMQNEKYCGAIRARKTYTPDYLTHKSRKNKGNKTQYYKANHHPAIISKEIYMATLKLIQLHKYVGSGYTLPELIVVEKGALRGYIPIDRNWNGFSLENYLEASKLVYKGIRKGKKKFLSNEDNNMDDLSGYVVVGNQLFSSKEDMYMTVSNGLIAFNLPCVEALKTESVCLYLNPIDLRLAILPEQNRGRNFKWAEWENKWKMRPKSMCGFDEIMYPALSWNKNYRYRVKGRAITRAGEKAIIFDLNCFETSIEDKTYYPESWKEDFGSKVGKIEDTDFSSDKFIIKYRECSEIATALPKEEMKKLEDEVRNLIYG